MSARNAPLLVSFASLARQGDSVILAGNAFAGFDEQVVRPNALVLMKLDGQSIPPPPGVWAFAMPRIALDGSGALHLLWGEPREPYRGLPAREFPPPVTHVWQASYRKRVGWSHPTLLTSGLLLDWEDQLLADIQSSVDGDLAIGLLATRRSGRDTPLLLLGRQGRWQEVTIGTSVQFQYIATAIHGRTIHVAGVGRATLTGTDDIYYVRSDDFGAHWSTSRLLAKARTADRFADVRVLAAPNGRLHIVWVSKAPARDEAVHLLHSRNGGGSWEPAPVVRTQSEPIGLRAVLDPQGTLHLTWEHILPNSPSGHIDHISWNDRWTPVDHLFGNLDAAGPAISTRANGDLTMTFLGAARTPSAAGPRFVSYVTSRSHAASCATR